MDYKQIINAILDESGMTQTELGEKIGCTQGHVSALAGGTRGVKMSKELGDAIEKEYKRIFRRRKAFQGAGSASDMDVATVVS